MDAWHWGRSWTGHALEDACPCPKEPCGLVNTGTVLDECEQHNPLRAKSSRQGHPASDCPGLPRGHADELEGGTR